MNPDLLQTTIPTYFNSIENKFKKYSRNRFLELTWILVTQLPKLVAILCFLPIIPLLLTLDDNPDDIHLDQLAKLINIQTPDDFLSIWIFLAIFALAVWLPILFFELLTKRKIEKVRDSHPNIQFCYAYVIKKEINSYLINEDESHIDKCLKYLRKLYKLICVIQLRTTGQDKPTTSNIFDIYTSLGEEHKWIKFDDITNKIFDGLAQFHPKIIKRVQVKEDLESVIEILDFLILHEYSKIKRNEIVENDVKLSQLTDDFMYKFAQGITKLQECKTTPIIKSNELSPIFGVFRGIRYYLTNSSLISLFFSWLIVLALIFYTIAEIVLHTTDTILDSTLLVAFITTPFIVAIGLASGLSNKTRK